MLRIRGLVGIITLRDLIIQDDGAPLADIMRRDFAAAGALEPALSVARRLLEDHLAALPVVAQDGRLLGAVTFDAAAAHITPPSARDIAPRVFS